MPMSSLNRKAWVTAVLLAVPLVTLGRTAAPAEPAGSTIRVTGEALATALPRISGELGASLGVGRSLANQRISILAAEADAALIKNGLVELLSASPQAPVLWQPQKATLTLEESQARRRLADELKHLDLKLYATHLEERVQWALNEGQKELEAAPPQRRRSAQDRWTEALLLASLGPEGRKRLVGGAPIVQRVGDAPHQLRGHLRQYIKDFSRELADVPSEQIDGYSLVLILSRSPNDARGTHLQRSFVTPEGFTWARSGLLMMPGIQVPPFVRRVFRLPAASAEDTSRRVSFCITPEPGARPGAMVRRNLDELLETVATACGMRLIADGYLRARIEIPANLHVRDYPINQLLTAITDVWGADWRLLKGDDRTVLVRSRNWWLEDLADVPEPLVARFRETLVHDRESRLEDLLEFAELSPPQAHKLVETGVAPGATALWSPYGTKMRASGRVFSSTSDFRRPYRSEPALEMACRFEMHPETSWMSG
jgi:hypothetical protein